MRLVAIGFLFLGLFGYSQLLRAEACVLPSASAYWPMDGSTDDVSGNNRDAVTQNAVNFNTNDSIKGGSSVIFSANTAIQYSNGIFLNSSASAITVSMFIKPDSLNGIQPLFDEGGNVNAFALRLNGGNLEGAILARNQGLDTVSTAFPTDGNWHHVALVFDNGLLSLYLDGEKKSSISTNKTTIPNHPDRGGIGRTYNHDAWTRDSYNYTGLIDEVSYYREALTDDEIRFVQGQFGCALVLDQDFSSSTMLAGDRTELVLTFTNDAPLPITAIDLTVNLPNAIWLDDTTLSGSCPNFALSGDRGGNTIRLTGGSIPGNTQCTVTVDVMSNVSGTHAVTINAFDSDPLKTLQLTTNDLSVIATQTAVCTPGNGAAGAIFMNVGESIYSVNLQTAKATLITNSPLVTRLNSLAIDPNNYLMYYADQGSASSVLYYYDLVNDQHGIISQEGGNVFTGLLGSAQLSSGGASFYNGSLYMGIEGNPQGQDGVIRVVMSEDGRTARYATTLLAFNNKEYGDLVVTGNTLNFFTRTNNPSFSRYSLLDFQELLNVSAPAVQGGAQRDGNTIWNVGTSLGITDTNTGSIQTYRPITTDGVNGPGNAADAAGCVPTTNRIGNQVWSDSNGNGVKDPDEQGIAGVTIDLYYDINNDQKIDSADDIAPFTAQDGLITAADRVAQSTTDQNGYYTFSGLSTDNYVVVVTDENNVLDNAQPTFTSSDPNRDAQAVSLGLLEDNDNINFGYRRFIDIRGQVINDHGDVTADNAHNTVLDDGETAIEGITIVIVDTATEVEFCRQLTDSEGKFQCLLDINLANTDLTIKQLPQNNFLFVNENVGNISVNTNNTTDGEIQFNTGSVTLYQDIVFSNVKENALSASQQSTVGIDSYTDYAHVFVANSAGDLLLEIDSVTQPDAQWSETVYLDSNCNSELDANEATPVNSQSNLHYGDTRCFVVRVSSPSNISVGAVHTLTLTARYLYRSTSMTDSIDVTDQTRVASNALRLIKTVTNISQATASGVDNTAKPGDQLRYDIRFINETDQPITQLIINDAVPAFTTALDIDNNAIAIECPNNQPDAPSITGCSVIEPALNNVQGYQGEISWQFNGELGAGEEGIVTFFVELE